MLPRPGILASSTLEQLPVKQKIPDSAYITLGILNGKIFHSDRNSLRNMNLIEDKQIEDKQGN